MLEAFSVALALAAFLFFFLSIKVKGDWEYLQILYLVVGFIFVIADGALMAVIATNIIITDMMFSFMWINIMAMLVVVFFFMLFFINNILQVMRKET